MPLLGGLRRKERQSDNGNTFVDPAVKASKRTRMGRMAKQAWGLPEPFSLGFVPYEPINGSFLKAVWAEFVVSVLFLYLTTGSVVFGCSVTDVGANNAGSSGGQTSEPVDCFLSTTRVLAIATSFGITIFVLVYAAAPFSGGHINPAVSLAFFLSKKLSVPRLVCYWAAQLGGAIVGSTLVKYTYKTGFHAGTGGANRLLPGFDKGGAWLLECVLTFILITVIFVATDQKRGQSTSHVPILAPLAIGFTVFVCHLAAVPLDGCSINPARSFGPAVMAGHWHNLWIFFAGPFSGATIAVLVYELTFRPSREPILTVDRHDDAAQSSVTIKLPGYTGASGLPSNEEAMDILKHRLADDTADQEIFGSGHVAQNGKPNGSLEPVNGQRRNLDSQGSFELHRTRDISDV